MHRLFFGALAALLLTPSVFAQSIASRSEALAHAQQRTERLLTLVAPPAPARASAEVLARIDGFLADGEWVLTQRTTHAYDGARRQTSTYFGAEVGEDLTPLYRVQHLYDAAGRIGELLTETYLESTQTFQPNDREVYTYDGAHALPTSIVRQYRAGNGWQNAERQTFALLDDGSAYTEGQTDEWNGSAWAPVARFTLAEIDGGTAFTDLVWSGTEWQHVERTFYPAFSLAELVAELNAFIRLSEEYFQLFFIASMAPDGLYEAWNGDAWEALSRQITTAHEGPSGSLTHVEKVIETFDGFSWTPDARILLTYESGNPAGFDRLEMQMPLFDDEWLTVLAEAYTYTATGRLATAEQGFLFDGEWEGGEREEPVFVPLALYAFEWVQAGVSTDGGAQPLALTLDAVFPNPTQGAATVAFELTTSAAVALHVYDALGRRVATLAEGTLPAGRHEARLDAAALPAGRYFVRLETPNARQTRPVTVIR